MTTWLWMGWKTIRCRKLTGIPLLIASLQANSKDESSLPCKALHLWQSKGLGQAVPLYYPLRGIRKRLAITTYVKVRYSLKTPYRDGTTGDWRCHMIFEPLDFVTRIATLVPKPRVNLTRFHGVFVWGGHHGVALHQTVVTARQ